MPPRHANPTGYDPAEPCRPFSEIAWPADLPLIEPAWRTETVLGIAANVRESKDFNALPILADALEDAGCDNLFVLNHCRSCEQHHPHCWVVSAVLINPTSLLAVQTLRGINKDPTPTVEWQEYEPQTQLGQFISSVERVFTWAIGILLVVVIATVVGFLVWGLLLSLGFNV